MRYGSLVASAVVLLGVAACRGNDAGMNADLAKDLAAAKTSDALALAPHAGEQTVVSAQELSPQARTRLRSSDRSTHAVAHRTPHKDRVTPAVSRVAASVPAPAPAQVEVADAPAPAPVATSDAPSASAPETPSPRPQPVDVPAQGSDQGGQRGDGNGVSIGGIIGAIGGAILRGGVVDGDHCDPRGHGRGGILINRRGPIFRGNF
jgi:pyruvate/2-oxoglutarate dehydrogenase complex dihydrolipoamide acyltransferase (E2) component